MYFFLFSGASFLAPGDARVAGVARATADWLQVAETAACVLHQAVPHHECLFRHPKVQRRQRGRLLHFTPLAAGACLGLLDLADFLRFAQSRDAAGDNIFLAWTPMPLLVASHHTLAHRLHGIIQAFTARVEGTYC
jgi:hypothetical protein